MRTGPRKGGGPGCRQAAGTQLYLPSRPSLLEKPPAWPQRWRAPPPPRALSEGKHPRGQAWAMVWHTGWDQAICLFPARVGVVGPWRAPVCSTGGHWPRPREPVGDVPGAQHSEPHHADEAIFGQGEMRARTPDLVQVTYSGNRGYPLSPQLLTRDSWAEVAGRRHCGNHPGLPRTAPLHTQRGAWLGPRSTSY